MRIRVVFLQDIPPKYMAGDIHEVAAGYARNYLIPKELAAPAVGDHLKRIEKVKQVAEGRRIQETVDMEELAQYIDGTTVTLMARASESGRLYGSITSALIAEELSRMLDRPIERRLIHLPEPIKEVGATQVPVRLYRDIAPTINVVVAAEGGALVEALEDESDQAVDQPSAEVAAEEPEGLEGEEGSRK